MDAKGFRKNAAGNTVCDIIRGERFVATVEIMSDGTLKVLMGSLQPAGKELAKKAIASAKGA